MKNAFSKISKMLAFALVNAFCQLAVAQTDTIPFTLNQQNNICVRATLNGSDSLVLMFHTASTGVTLTQTAIEKKTRLKTDQTHTVTTWGGKAEAGVTEGNLLKIKNLTWDSLAIFVNENSGVDTDGKFGYDLFEGKIVSIDYEKMWLLVQPQLPRRIPRGFSKQDLIFVGGTPCIEGVLMVGKTAYRDTFMFHTGYGGSILLDPKIGENHRMQATLPTISTSELSDAYGNVFKIETKSLPEVRIGRAKLRDVPLSFAARSSEIPMKVFGNGLLRQFNVIFDFRENKVYLKRNRIG